MARPLVRAIMPAVGAELAAAFVSMGSAIHGYYPRTCAQDPPAPATRREGDGAGPLGGITALGTTGAKRHEGTASP